MARGHTSSVATKAPVPGQAAGPLEKQADESRRELIRISRAYARARQPLSTSSHAPVSAVTGAPRQAVRWFPAPSRNDAPFVKREAQSQLPRLEPRWEQRQWIEIDLR